jgi:hypothetical protein
MSTQGDLIGVALQLLQPAPEGADGLLLQPPLLPHRLHWTVLLHNTIRAQKKDNCGVVKSCRTKHFKGTQD